MMMAESRKVSSPDGKMVVEVKVENGKATYTVQYDGVEMLQKSRLGIETNVGDFTKDLSFVGSKEGVIEQSYDLSRSKTSHVDIATLFQPACNASVIQVIDSQALVFQ